MWYGTCSTEVGTFRMAIDLPRNPRALHFTGSVKALAPERPANALGQQRPNAPPPPPPSRAVPSSRPPAAMISTPTRLTTMRGPRDPIASMDEDILTEALDRDEINAALFPIARRPDSDKPSPNLPVPGFRSVEEAKAQLMAPRIVMAAPRADAKGGSLPLGVWLMAALVAGILSFHFAPEARDGLESAVRALDSR